MLLQGTSLSRRPPVDAASGDFTLPEYENTVTLSSPGISENRLLLNRRFSEIPGEDNLTVFSYSGRVKSPEWRRQRRRADLRQF